MGNMESREGIKPFLFRKWPSFHRRGQKWGRHGELLIHPQSIQICLSLHRFLWERAPLETLLGKLLLHRGAGNVLTLMGRTVSPVLGLK